MYIVKNILFEANKKSSPFKNRIRHVYFHGRLIVKAYFFLRFFIFFSKKKSFILFIFFLIGRFHSFQFDLHVDGERNLFGALTKCDALGGTIRLS